MHAALPVRASARKRERNARPTPHLGRFAITSTVRILAASTVACVVALTWVPVGAAQPAPPTPAPDDVAALPAAPVDAMPPEPVDAAPEAVAACRQFARALDTAALSYGEFANVLAIGENNPDYLDPIVAQNNAYGRAGLREAASLAVEASRVPGLQPDVAAPMRTWSMGAVKLLLLMGLRVDVDRFNNAATELNSHTEAAQMACARAGTKA